MDLNGINNGINLALHKAFIIAIKTPFYLLKINY